LWIYPRCGCARVADVLMKIIAGLGNPGKQYEETRHNLGFAVTDELARRYSVECNRSAFRSLFGSVVIAGEKCILLKPMTYVNLSGEAVGAAWRYFRCGLDDLMVICDDLNLPLGRLRLRRKGSSGGHKGLRSVIKALGTEEFARLRIGIGNEITGDARDFVLSRFSEEEAPVAQEAVSRAADAVEMWVEHGVERAMNCFNSGPEASEKDRGG